MTSLKVMALSENEVCKNDCKKHKKPFSHKVMSGFRFIRYLCDDCLDGMNKLKGAKQ